MLDELPILDLGRTPIPGPAATGVDAADDPDYILVNDEMSKADRVDTGPPEWRSIESSAVSLLGSKSKDLEIASYLALALFRREGYDGLSAGLGLILEMINMFWDGLFPERPRRRKARIEGLCERFTEGGWFRDEEFRPERSFDAIDKCLERITAIEESLKSRMADDPPDFAKFKRALKEYAAQRPKEAAPAAPAPTTGGGPASSGGAATSTAGGGGSFAGGEVADRSGAISAMMAAVTFLRKADLADPVPYAVARAIKWSTMVLPPESARTQIEPPEKSVVEALAHQFASSLWENLLKNAEAAFRSGDPLWLDVQRYVCLAMAGMGPNFERARQAVMGATAGLVRRLAHGIFDLRFRDGTPLCSGETRLWIESEVAPPTSAKSGGHGGSNGKLAEAVQKARELAGGGKLQEALGELHNGLVASTEKRDRLMWRLQIAGLCFDAQRLQMAHNILQECSAAIRDHRIDEWEPSLAVDVAHALYRCQRALANADKTPPAELLQSMRETYKWLCELDSMAAFSIDPPGK